MTSIVVRNIFILLAILTIAACQNPIEESAWPDDIEGKTSLLEEKKQTLRELERDIKQLQDEIAALDPSRSENKALVRTTKVVVRPFKHFVEIQANVESDDVVMASAERGGRIIAMPVKEGDYVRKGQLIARLDLESVNKQIQEVETSLRLAKTVYERQEKLWNQNIGSEIQYLEAKNNKERLEKTLETLRYELGKSTVYAPISGEVDQVFQKGGEMVSPGMPILQILNSSRVKVIADVPENYLGKVNQGDIVTIRFPALELEREARINRIGASINPNNRTFEVEVMLNNADRLLKPNLLGIMLVEDYANDKAIAIPVELVQEEIGGKDYVMTATQVDGQLVASKKYVATGLTNEGLMEIKDGLMAGDTLITTGARGLAKSTPITIKNESMADNDGE